jgi:hypothetical protein
VAGLEFRDMRFNACTHRRGTSVIDTETFAAEFFSKSPHGSDKKVSALNVPWA